MKIASSLLVLELDNNKDYSVEEIRKQYKSLALLYHPDKNLSENTTEKFQKIQEAYDYLIKYYDNIADDIADDLTDDINETYFAEENEKGSYIWFLYSFLKDFLKGDKLLLSIIENVLCSCEEKALELLRKLDKQILIKTYDFIKKYREVLHINEQFLCKIENIITEKSSNDKHIILNPTINDLFLNNLYRLTYYDKVFIIPLWHNELIYDYNGCDICVKCNPILPDNVKIDEYNNIIVNIEVNIKDIWEEERFSITIGDYECWIQTSKLKIYKQQTLTLHKQGISKINTIDIYDISIKSDIIVNITLY